MNKVQIIIFFFFNVQFGFCQWSAGLNAGFGEQIREIPEAYTDNLVSPSLAIDVNYNLDTLPLIFNLSTYFLHKSRSEIFPSSNNFHSLYFSPVIIMTGVGFESSSQGFLSISTFLQLGYWHTRSRHSYYYSYPMDDQLKSFERKMDQFAIGPKINVGIGKKQLKGVLTFENYFLSSTQITPYSFFGRERFTRVSIGFNYNFKR
jgi:hypothetical protein